MINLNQKFEKIERLTNEGYELQIGNYINEAFDIFKKNAGGFIVYTLVILGVSLVARAIPFFGGLLSIAISAPLHIGYAIMSRKIRNNEAFDFNDFFWGFNRFADLFVVYLVSLIFVIIGLVCLILPGIYLSVAYCFASMLVWFMYDGNAMDTLERSRKLISKRWWSFLAFFLVIMLLNLGGALCLLVGLLVTIPVSSIALYVCFEDLVGTNEEVEATVQQPQPPVY